MKLHCEAPVPDFKFERKHCRTLTLAGVFLKWTRARKETNGSYRTLACTKLVEWPTSQRSANDQCERLNWYESRWPRPGFWLIAIESPCSESLRRSTPSTKPPGNDRSNKKPSEQRCTSLRLWCKPLNMNLMANFWGGLIRLDHGKLDGRLIQQFNVECPVEDEQKIR